ncbi:site-specific integrase [Streptococcus plurextorum]|uniref:site-specific integrase n=1 Tax=Streptococcus plurextorum TaxID=456876 RepID=UPI00040B55C5
MGYIDYSKEPRSDIAFVDMKSFYASIECVERGLHPLHTSLCVMSRADNSSGLILASSPMFKKVFGKGNVGRAYDLPFDIQTRKFNYCFRKHILPMLGNYTIQFLNQNKQVILNLMTAKANEYANFKTLRSYVISIFDWAEELEYIESNKIAKTLRRIKATKKIQLAEARRDEDLYLTHEQLQEWFLAFQEDLANEKISLKDYLLFYLTFFLGDRKSESYALQWKHIDFEKSQIQLLQALDRYGDTKATKGNKKTIFAISAELLQLLLSWKKQQRRELAKFGIITNSEQFVFSYVDTKGNVNKPLHADYLNNKMRTVKNRHPYLTHATPHKLRHTGATLAKQAGMSLEAISEALTHSDTTTTQIYVNTSNVIPMAVGEFALNSLKQ